MNMNHFLHESEIKAMRVKLFNPNWPCRIQPFIDPGPSSTEIFLHQMILNYAFIINYTFITHITGDGVLPWREGK